LKLWKRKVLFDLKAELLRVAGENVVYEVLKELGYSNLEAIEDSEPTNEAINSIDFLWALINKKFDDYKKVKDVEGKNELITNGQIYEFKKDEDAEDFYEESLKPELQKQKDSRKTDEQRNTVSYLVRGTKMDYQVFIKHGTNRAGGYVKVTIEKIDKEDY